MKFIQRHIEPLKNENGFALITTILILAILTFIGIAGTNTTIFELKIVSNEQQAHKKFYTADSGWKQAGPFLNNKAAPPNIINLTLRSDDTNYVWTDEFYQIIRNFGDGTDGILNDTYPIGSIDGALSNIPYWYRLRYITDNQAIGFGANYREFQYEDICRAQGDTKVITTIKKVFRVGY